jgi:hypothetical protein
LIDALVGEEEKVFFSIWRCHLICETV